MWDPTPGLLLDRTQASAQRRSATNSAHDAHPLTVGVHVACHDIPTGSESRLRPGKTTRRFGPSAGPRRRPGTHRHPSPIPRGSSRQATPAMGPTAPAHPMPLFSRCQATYRNRGDGILTSAEGPLRCQAIGTGDAKGGVQSTLAAVTPKPEPQANGNRRAVPTTSPAPWQPGRRRVPTNPSPVPVSVRSGLV